MKEGDPTGSAKALLGLAEGWRFYAGLIILVSALGCGLAGLLNFPLESQGGAGWALQSAGIMLFALAIPLLFRGPRDTEPAEPLTLQVLVFGLIVVALAVFMRFYRLAELPFGTWYDEAELGMRAKEILENPAYRPIYLPLQTVGFYLPALIGQSFGLLGVSTLALRAVMALFGVASVVVAFFLGREIYGNRFGLLLAFFFAVSRWPINFDRLGMPTSTGPFFILLILLLLFRGKRSGSTRYFAWAGLALGVSLGFHTSLRLFPLVALVFLAYWMAGQIRRHPGERSWRIVWSVNLAALAIGAALAAGPMVQFAVREPDDFWYRTGQVSIFENRLEPSLARAVGSNTVKNLLMFNYQGDYNGRHNLPGEPMLDPVTGAMFVLGLVLALSRFRRPAEMIFLLLFMVGLAGAIFTVDFESPQAQRAVGAMAAVFFFSALASEAFWRLLDRSSRPFWARPLGSLLLVLSGAAIVYANTNTYFVRQANNSAVWREHSAVETITADKMRELSDEDPAFYLSMFLHDHSVINFLAPGLEAEVISGSDILPLREPGDRPAVVMTGVEQAWIAEAVDRFYPNAQLTIASNPDGAPMQYTVVVPPQDIRQVQGLQAEYWAGDSRLGQAEITRVEGGVNARWPADAPLDGPFTAKWSGVLYAPEFGDYRLTLQSPGPAMLWLDGEALMETDTGGEQSVSRTVAKGNHTLRLEAESSEGLIRLSWRRPSGGDPETIPAWALYYGPQVASQGLLGTFYEGGDWNAEPALQRIDPFLDAYFHLLPFSRPYGVIWSGQIEVPQDGEYAFGLEVTGRAQLYIDDQLVVIAPEPTPYQEGAIDLEAGRHDLRLQFLDYLGGSRLHLYWTPPGQARHIIPADVLFPVPAPQ